LSRSAHAGIVGLASAGQSAWPSALHKHPVDDTYSSLIIAPVNAIDWQPKALRQLRKVDAHAGKQIRTAVTTELVAKAYPLRQAL
jgi:hypothetical protein